MNSCHVGKTGSCQASSECPLATSMQSTHVVHVSRPTELHGGWRAILEGAMRADGRVVFTPSVQNHLRFYDGREGIAVQALVAELAIEALDEGILHRFAGLVYP